MFAAIARFFDRFQNVILIISSTFLFISVCVTVFMRYVLEISMYGMTEIVLMVAMWTYFMGACKCSKEESHITAEVLDVMIKNTTVLKCMTLLGRTIMVFISIAFAYYGIAFLQESLDLITNTPYYHIPYSFGHASVCYGAIVMAIYTISHYIKYIKKDFFSKENQKMNHIVEDEVNGK